MKARFAIALALFAALSVGWFQANRTSFHPTTFQYDFVAFYCASAVAQEGADPYLTEPLRTCEHQNGHAFRAGSRLAVPAPVPGYDLAALAPLARLPFAWASALWLLLQIAAYALTIALLVRLTKCEPWIALAATILSDAYLSMLLGQLVPFAVLGVVAAAYGLRRERFELLGGGLALLALEPHLALPVYASVLIFVPRARIVLVGICAALIVASLAILGPAENLEYFTAVLPAHAASEIANQEQYSLTYLAHVVGANDALAVRLGEFSYLFMTALGIALGAALRKRTNDLAPLVLVPVAAAVFGGGFVHVQQFAVVIPFALWLASRSRERAPAISLALLAVPWGVFFALVPFAPLAALAVGFILHRLGRFSLRTALIAAGAALAILCYAEIFRPFAGPPPNYALLGTNDGATLAETSWRFLIESGFHLAVPLYVAMKLPSWFAIARVLIEGGRIAGWRATTSREFAQLPGASPQAGRT
ncbi:MAG: DUF2029 domain-containing protein [Candidatus Eremiobacteraeota bacterium]|nr:DUF2029 domain-containing protein [Candidatus Eremiobacteraeota bacterium]